MPRPITAAFAALAALHATASPAFPGPLSAQEELLTGGGFDDGAAGGAFAPANGAGVTGRVDAEEGSVAPGSLAIEVTAEGYAGIAVWSFAVDLADPPPARLALSAAMRAEGFAAGTKAQVMAQLVDGDGAFVAYPRAEWIEEDCPWRPVRTVFDVPAGIWRVRVLCWTQGAGRVWFDDLSLVESTEDPVSHDSPRAFAARTDDRMEALARGAAGDLPWQFDADAARAVARERGVPLLAYVRCTDWRAGMAALRETIAGEGVPFSEDGFAKDVLFRAGPLSVPEVAALVRGSFVPLCLTYVLADSLRPADGLPPGWGRTTFPGDLRMEVSPDGDPAGGGCLVIASSAAEDRMPHNWYQAVAWDGAATELRLAARLSAAGFREGSEACVMVQCWRGTDALAYGRVEALKADCDWTLRESAVSVPEGVDTIRLLAYLVGAGEARFDDVALVDPAGVDLLVNGALDRAAPEPGTLAGLPIDVGGIATPALVAFGPDGALLGRLHRQGTLSDDLVERWLRAMLARAGVDAPPETLPDELAPVRACLRAGDWEGGLAAIAALGEDAAAGDVAERARFWRAWCLARLGRWSDARAGFAALAGESPIGRAAAACATPRGPRLTEAMSLRAWPSEDDVPEDTEGFAGSFDPRRSVVALLELQRADGSFGSQLGVEGHGWNDPAITALAIDALRTWGARLADLRPRTDAARARALAWLVAKAREEGTMRTLPAAFHNPYSLRTLLAEGELEGAELVLGHVLATQLPDGNWSVYGADRPASFNTALNVLALLAARDAGLAPPAEALERGLDALAAMRQAGDLFPYSTKPGHEWMTTEHGSIARDALCEHALLAAGRGSPAALDAALGRYWRFSPELRPPTKRLYDYFDARGHGGYYFFFAHRRALEAAGAFASDTSFARTRAHAREAVLAAQEGDGTFVDQFLLGRAYGTAQALLVLAQE